MNKKNIQSVGLMCLGKKVFPISGYIGIKVVGDMTTFSFAKSRDASYPSCRIKYNYAKSEVA